MSQGDRSAMDEKRVSEIKQDLEEVFGTGNVALLPVNDGSVYFKIGKAPLAIGCIPSETPVLIVFRQNNPQPETYVAQGILLSTGRTPNKGISPAQVIGEPWLSFSYTCPWDPARDKVSKFILSRLSRFSLND